MLSQAAYDPVKYQKHYQDVGYELDQDLSQKSISVFYNKAKNRAVIAYKGTDPSHLSDLIADGQIVNGMDEYLSGRFRGAEKVYRQTTKKCGRENVQVTGHSLGGSQAVHVGRKYGATGTLRRLANVQDKRNKPEQQPKPKNKRSFKSSNQMH